MTSSSTSAHAMAFPPITKPDASTLAVAPHLGDYATSQTAFNWDTIEAKLNLPRQHGGYNKASICIDGHSPEVMKRDALIWHSTEGAIEQYTFNDLKAKTNQVAHFLTELGLNSGDRVFVFMERIPELYITLFGALKCQAVVGPLFSAFGPEAIRDRVQDCEARFIVTTPSLKPRIDSILAECPSIETVIVVDRTQQFEPSSPSEVSYYPAVDTMSAEFEVPYTDKDAYSIIHYTSGTTGKPKGAVHRHYALVSQAATAQTVLDLHPDSDLYWCTADPGWVTGTSYGMFGPWAWGTTQLVYEGPFNAKTWYDLLTEHQVTVWYTAPTAIRMLMKAGDELVHQYPFPHLRHLLSVGEPLNPEAIQWGLKAFHGLGFHDTWWQTETGCMHICNYPSMTIKPGSMGRPHPGVEAAILTDDGELCPAGTEGDLVVKPTAPSFFRTYWKRDELYQSRIKNGWYLTGDRAWQDEDGYFWFVGRSDDVINTAGHLVGPFEVESALIEHPAVAEAGVIGKPDPERMEVVKAFVSLKAGYEPSDTLKTEIQQFVRTRLAAHAMPRDIEFIDSLPKTRSGKIMRRLLKARELGLPEGDTSTLEE